MLRTFCCLAVSSFWLCGCATAFFASSLNAVTSGARSASRLHSSVPASPPQPREPLPDGFYHETGLDKLSLALFRNLVQREIGFKSEKEGYEGLIEEAHNYMVVQKATPEQQVDMVQRCLKTIAGPLVPPVYRTFMAPWPWAPFLTAFFTPPFFKFLVGPNKLDMRSDGTAGGVFVERCRFLEETNCKGLCTNMCKLPTQKFFKDTLGLDMAMEPDFDTYECRLSFGLTPLPMDQDPKVPKGCLQGCSSRALGAEIETVCSKQ
eukprot:TRINITY_DN2449_c0_g1_i2.p1 TRINITY_DN2449_c0_g1~~TRINITY_DN2449_c0_g1_i2.p1  ORF type:complete len:263 (-),score=66.13 TRINITY_DN2449_c0_g1_i2:73-861(-)